ncbi:MAG: helix-turn-helix domain-containing protein [Candidatus Woesearchaeota archaeon]
MDTLEQQILVMLRKSESGLTINQISLHAKKDRHTIAKYLEKMQSQGLIEMRTRGKSKIYSITESSLISAMKKNDSLAAELSQVFQALDQKVMLKTKNDLINYNRCFEHAGNNAVCKNCPVEETFKTGKSSTTRGKYADITAHPITKDNDVIAVVEIIKKRKSTK